MKREQLLMGAALNVIVAVALTVATFTWVCSGVDGGSTCSTPTLVSFLVPPGFLIAIATWAIYTWFRRAPLTETAIEAQEGVDYDRMGWGQRPAATNPLDTLLHCCGVKQDRDSTAIRPLDPMGSLDTGQHGGMAKNGK